MANTISEGFVQAYRGNVIHRAQQHDSRLQDTVVVERGNREKENFDRIGAVTDEEKTTRHKDTPVADTPHDRRVVTLRTFQWADLIDNDDKLKMMQNPESEYVIAGSRAMGRRKDNLILRAATGNSVDATAGNVALPASQIIVHGATGMTLAKLLSAKEILLGSDIDEDEEMITCVMGSKQLHELLNDDKLTSADYNTVRALVDGKIDTFLGAKFKRTEQVEFDTDHDKCVMYGKHGMGLAVNEEITVDIGVRRDKSNAMQVYIEYNAAATRIEEERVVEIQCANTA